MSVDLSATFAAFVRFFKAPITADIRRPSSSAELGWFSDDAKSASKFDLTI